jgi:hypothetical protein
MPVRLRSTEASTPAPIWNFIMEFYTQPFDSERSTQDSGSAEIAGATVAGCAIVYV